MNNSSIFNSSHPNHAPPPQPAAAASVAEQEQSIYQNMHPQHENTDAQVSQPASSAAGYGPAMLDQQGSMLLQMSSQQRPITTTTNRHISDYPDSFEWEGTSAGTNIASRGYTSHPNSSTDSLYQPLSFGTHHRHQQQAQTAWPFGSFSDSHNNYFTHSAIQAPASEPATSRNVYQVQPATATTHNVFAQPSSSILPPSTNPMHMQGGSYMAVDTPPISSRLEQESEGYLSPSSSEPMSATPDPSHFILPSQMSTSGGQQASLSSFGRSASPSPSYTHTSNYPLSNTSQSLSIGNTAAYRTSRTHYSSSGGLSDSSMDTDSPTSTFTMQMHMHMHSTSNPLLKQELHRNGKPKRPLNSFMIFARKRRPDLQKLNPNMKVADIAKELSKEWKDMPADQKKEYFEAAKIVKESFHKMHPDYVYTRRANGSRKSSRGDGSSSTSGHRRRASSATPSSSGSTTGGGAAADIGESALSPPNILSASSPPSMIYGAATSSGHKGKTRSRPLAGSKGASGAGGGHSGVRSSDSERSAFSPGYESNTSDAEMGNIHMPMPLPTHISQSFSLPSPVAGAAGQEDTASPFRSLSGTCTSQPSSDSKMMDYDAPPLQQAQAQMSSSTSSAPGYLETHMSPDAPIPQASANTIQSFEDQLLSYSGRPAGQNAQSSLSSGSFTTTHISDVLQSSIYFPSLSVPQQHQQAPLGNIFASPSPMPRQQPPMAASNSADGISGAKHVRPSTGQSGYMQAQTRPASTSRFGIHSFRNAGLSAPRSSNSFFEQPGSTLSSEGDTLVGQQQQYQSRADSIFKEPSASTQTPSVSATLRAAMNSPSRLSMRSLQSFPDLSINTSSPQSRQPHQQQQQQEMSWMHSPSVTSPAVAPGHRYSGYDAPQPMSGISMDDSYIHDSGGSWLHSGPGKSIESPTGIVRMNSPPPVHMLRHAASTFSLPTSRQGNVGRTVFNQSASRPSGISQTFARPRSPSRGGSSSEESTGPTLSREARSRGLRPPLLNPYAAYASAPPTAGTGQPAMAPDASSSTSYFSGPVTPASAPPTAHSDRFLVPQTPSSSDRTSSSTAKSARASRRAHLVAGVRSDREGSCASFTSATTSRERASSLAARASGLVYNGTGKARYTPLSYDETSVARSYPLEAFTSTVRTSNQAPLPVPSDRRASYVPGTPVTLAPLRRDSIQGATAGEAKEAEQTRLPSLADNLDAGSDPAGARQLYADYVQSQYANVNTQHHSDMNDPSHSRHEGGQPYQAAQK